jgi:hypothetical protein
VRKDAKGTKETRVNKEIKAEAASQIITRMQTAILTANKWFVAVT